MESENGEKLYRLRIFSIILDHRNQEVNNKYGWLDDNNSDQFLYIFEQEINNHYIDFLSKIPPNIKTNSIEYGKIIYNQGQQVAYEGFFIHKTPYGTECKIYHQNGNLCYEGGFDENGNKSGFGKEFYNNGQLRYEGSFQNNYYHGKNCTVYSLNTSQNIEKHDIEFEGNLIEGYPDGYIKKYNISRLIESHYYITTLDLYQKYNFCVKAYCKDGYIHDKGVILRECILKNDSPSAKNRYSYPIIYIGDFKNGKFDGFGTKYIYKSINLKPLDTSLDIKQSEFIDSSQLYYKEKKTYEGSYLKGVHHGKNCKLYKSISIEANVDYIFLKYYGDFEHGLFQGRGIYYVEPTNNSEIMKFINNLEQNETDSYKAKKIQYCGYFSNGKPDLKYNNGNTEIVESNGMSISVIIDKCIEDSGKTVRSCEKYYSGSVGSDDPRQGYLKIVSKIDENWRLNDKNAVIYADLPQEQISYRGSIEDGVYNGYGVVYDQETGNPIYSGDFLNGNLYNLHGKVMKKAVLFSGIRYLIFIGPYEKGLPANFHNNKDDKTAIYGVNGKKYFMGNYKIGFNSKYDFCINYYENGQIKQIKKKTEKSTQIIEYSLAGSQTYCSKNFYI